MPGLSQIQLGAEMGKGEGTPKKATTALFTEKLPGEVYTRAESLEPCLGSPV